MMVQGFQSTQPSQAVTWGDGVMQAASNISIHTALAGCDGILELVFKYVH